MDKNSVKMVQNQLIPRGVTDKKILSVMEKIPRQAFVPDKFKDLAYEDGPLPIGEGQTISQPFMVAWMSELLKLTGREKVLEIGTGSGYQTAVLAELSAEVYSVETIRSLSESAQKILKGLNYNNVHFKIGDGSLGWVEKAPFDRIIVTAAAEEMPAPLFEQLSEKGKIVIPIGERFFQVLTVIDKINGKTHITRLGGCTFVPLVGEHGMDKTGK